MTRYFMTIPEAVQLVIRAADLGGAGDVFVLEMGEPVKIVDLARNMIRLAGYEPDADIAIEFTGPRPGEQLHERLLADDEHAEPTAAARIVRAVRDSPIDPAAVEETMQELRKLTDSGDETGLAERVVGLISPGAGGEAGADLAGLH
jgi:FlaA1/EpsC-like NDP-sugar epimerase